MDEGAPPFAPLVAYLKPESLALVRVTDPTSDSAWLLLLIAAGLGVAGVWWYLYYDPEDPRLPLSLRLLIPSPPRR